MSLRPSSLLAALAYAGAAFLFGLALGERGELGLVQGVFALVIPMSTFLLGVMAKPMRRANVFLTGAAMLAGLLLGHQTFARAWDECLARGAGVRTAVMQHHDEHDVYPARLDELPAEVPCRCLTRPTILHYLANERGFRLWMTNEVEVVDFSSSSGRSSVPPRR